MSLRFGVVLSASGGALPRMLLPFRMGVGGAIGGGGQYMSWIAVDDVAPAIRHVLEDDSIVGPVNMTTPEPVTNRRFAKALGEALRRPAVVPLPALVARIALGEMADGLLLASARVAPRKLLHSGYDFRYPELPGALGHLLGKHG